MPPRIYRAVDPTGSPRTNLAAVCGVEPNLIRLFCSVPLRPLHPRNCFQYRPFCALSFGGRASRGWELGVQSVVGIENCDCLCIQLEPTRAKWPANPKCQTGKEEKLVFFFATGLRLDAGKSVGRALELHSRKEAKTPELIELRNSLTASSQSNHDVSTGF